MAIDPPISNYRPADHLSEPYLLLLKMLIAIQVRPLFMFVLCNANEQVSFPASGRILKVIWLFRSDAGMFCPVPALDCGAPYLCVCVHKGAPWGVCLSLFVFVRGFFVANTHFITLTLIKNTWPYSRGQSVHKSAQCSVQHSPSKALRPLLLRS